MSEERERAGSLEGNVQCNKFTIMTIVPGTDSHDRRDFRRRPKRLNDNDVIRDAF